MKTLSAFFLLSSIFTACIFSMEIEKPKPLLKLEPIIKFYPGNSPKEDTFPYDLKKAILLKLAQNVHYYVRSVDISKRAQFASEIIGYVSFVNKDLYKELDKQRNDPITVRPILIDIACGIHYKYCNYFYVENMPLPGAQKCIEYSKQLTDETLTPDKAEQLVKKGAILNYHHQNCQSPLSYWCCIMHNNSPQSVAVFKKLLELGANHNEFNVLNYIMDTNGNMDLISEILKYPTQKNKRVWIAAIQKQEYVDLLIPTSTPDELNIGLRACIDQYSDYKPEMMQQFIDSGANPDDILYRTMENLLCWNQITPSGSFLVSSFRDSAVNKLNFLCMEGAFDQRVLNTLKYKRDIFDCLIQQLEKNQTLRDIKITEK